MHDKFLVNSIRDAFQSLGTSKYPNSLESTTIMQLVHQAIAAKARVAPEFIQITIITPISDSTSGSGLLKSLSVTGIESRSSPDGAFSTHMFAWLDR